MPAVNIEIGDKHHLIESGLMFTPYREFRFNDGNIGHVYSNEIQGDFVWGNSDFYMMIEVDSFTSADYEANLEFLRSSMDIFTEIAKTLTPPPGFEHASPDSEQIMEQQEVPETFSQQQVTVHDVGWEVSRIRDIWQRSRDEISAGNAQESGTAEVRNCP